MRSHTHSAARAEAPPGPHRTAPLRIPLAAAAAEGTPAARSTNCGCARSGAMAAAATDSNADALLGNLVASSAEIRQLDTFEFGVDQPSIEARPISISYEPCMDATMADASALGLDPLTTEAHIIASLVRVRAVGTAAGLCVSVCVLAARPRPGRGAAAAVLPPLLLGRVSL